MTKLTFMGLALALVAGASAQTFTANGSYVIEDSGTYSATGSYLNFGLTGSGLYKSYAALDFSSSALSSIGSIKSATLTIQESDYTSTSSVPVTLTVYAVSNNTISLAKGQTTVEYDDSTLGGLDATSALGTATKLGSFVFNPNGLTNGGLSDQQDTINLTSGLSAIASQINSSAQDIRLVITTSETGEVTLTGAGTASAYLPTLNITAAPEPASMAALGIGIAGLVARKRRK